MKIADGLLTAGILRTMIQELKDDDPILIIVEDFDSGVGGNAFEIEFTPALEGEEKDNAIKDDDIWQSTIWITG